MAIEEDEGSDIFWPGYVDAVTNLVLNLLFMLTIMIVAVFMFALEINRHKDDVPLPKIEAIVSDVPALEAVKDLVFQKKLDDIVKANDVEVSELKKQIEALSKQIVQADHVQQTAKIVIAKTPLPKPSKNLEETMRSGDVIVDFKLESVTLSEEESVKLRDALATIADGGAAQIEIFVPAGFSEAKRIGFYRAIAVRNQLIEMKVPNDMITMLVHEGLASADNTKVLVSKQ